MNQLLTSRTSRYGNRLAAPLPGSVDSLPPDPATAFLTPELEDASEAAALMPLRLLRATTTTPICE